MKRVLFLSIIVLVAFTNKSISIQSLKTGMWRGVLQLNDTTELPFNFEVKNTGKKFLLEIINGTEHIKVDEINFRNDSLFMVMPFFDSEFQVKLTGDSLMKGTWINHARKINNTITFNARSGENKRFLFSSDKQSASKQRYKVTFEPGTKDEYLSVGMFTTDAGTTKGTFTTETGDYRYLEGYQANDKFMVSCFDGAHAFLFTGKIKGDSIVNGNFYSGAHGHETWIAHKDDKI